MSGYVCACSGLYLVLQPRSDFDKSSCKKASLESLLKFFGGCTTNLHHIPACFSGWQKTRGTMNVHMSKPMCSWVTVCMIMCVCVCVCVCVRAPARTRACVSLHRLTCGVQRTINTIDGLYSVRVVGYKIALVGNAEQKETTRGVPHKSMYVRMCVCVCVCV